MSGKRGCPATSTQSASWYISSVAVANASSACDSVSGQLTGGTDLVLNNGALSQSASCLAGNLTCRHGGLAVPVSTAGQLFTDTVITLDGPLSVVDRVLVVAVGATRYCTVIQGSPNVALVDADMNPGRRGIAVVDASSGYGVWETRAPGASTWVPLDRLTRANALLVNVSTGAPQRSFRFVPDPTFAGVETCPQCPSARTTVSCVPCPLNRTAASISFVGWDGTVGVDGAIASAAYTGAHGAFSEGTKTVAVDVNPRGINVSAPDGSVFNVTYRVEDNLGNAAPPLRRTVTVRDTIAPVVSLRGNASMTIEAATSYVERGAVAFDRRDGDVTHMVAITSIVGQGSFGPASVPFDPSTACGSGGVFVYRMPYGGDGTLNLTVRVLCSTLPFVGIHRTNDG